MHRKNLLSLFWLLMPYLLWAQVTGKISGRVVDANSGQPLPGVNVQIVGTSRGASTDMNGEFYILNLQPGAYVLEFSMVGYQTVRL